MTPKYIHSTGHLAVDQSPCASTILHQSTVSRALVLLLSILIKKKKKIEQQTGLFVRSNDVLAVIEWAEQAQKTLYNNGPK